MEAAAARIIKPILVGPETRIRALAASLGLDLSGLRLVDTPHSHASAAQAVALAVERKVEALMKGSLHTEEFMSAIVGEEKMRTARRMSHVFLIDVPGYPRPLFVTDAAVIIYPTLEDKVDIVQNVIDLAHVLGLALPKVAILSAVETVSSKIKSTIDAAALCKMADRGQITGGVLTVGELRANLARNHRADYTCPLTTGIFLRVVAEAAEEERATLGGRIAPYWRVVHDDGTMIDKLPGGVAAQARRLAEEDVVIFHLGKGPVVSGLEHFAWHPPLLGKALGRKVEAGTVGVGTRDVKRARKKGGKGSSTGWTRKPPVSSSSPRPTARTGRSAPRSRPGPSSGGMRP